MEKNYNDFLKNYLVKISGGVKDNLGKYEKYILEIYDEKKKTNSFYHIHECLSKKSNLFDLYKELYKLRLEINELQILLWEKENLKNYDLDLLKQIKSLIYTQDFHFNKKLDSLLDIILELNQSLYFTLDRFGDNKLDRTLEFFRLLGFVDFKGEYHIFVQGNANYLKRVLSNSIEQLKEEFNLNNATLSGDILNIPVVSFMYDEIFTPYFLNTILNGSWSKKYISVDDKENKYKKNGLCLVNFNIIYKKKIKQILTYRIH